MELEASPNKPKLSLTNLEIQNNCYVVPGNGRYHYFPVKIEESANPLFLSFKKGPPIIVDGMVFFKKKMYEVSSDDILRGRICKSKIIQRENQNGNSSARKGNSSNSALATAATVGAITVETVRPDNQSATMPAAVLEVVKDANAAWEDQIDSLLDHVSSQEGGEWEVADSA
jgi:hypothetical protein